MRCSSGLGGRARLLAVAGMLACAGSLRAQEASPIAPSVLPGDRVRVDIAARVGGLGAGRHVGTAERVGADTLWFQAERRDTTAAIAWSGVRAVDLSVGYLERREAVWRGAWIGAGAGLVVAAVQFLAGGGSCSNLREPSCYLTARGLAIVVGGAAVGGLVGVVSAGERWKPVYPVQVQLGVARPEPGRADIGLSIRVR